MNQQYDVRVFNTVADKANPTDYIGEYHINILCRGGNARFFIAEHSFTISSGDFVAWTIDAEVTGVVYSPDFNADVLLVSRNFLLENNPHSAWATKGYLYIKETPVFHLGDDDLAMLMVDFSRFKAQLGKAGHIFGREILGRLMQIFLYDLWNIFAAELSRLGSVNGTAANLFARFLDLVSQKSGEYRKVAFYADALCVTPKYLTEVVRKVSGRPASYWISGYAVQEIVSLLKRHDISISEISGRMNFNSPSHFSRYVKNELGVSPAEYRAGLINKR